MFRFLKKLILLVLCTSILCACNHSQSDESNQALEEVKVTAKCTDIINNTNHEISNNVTDIIKSYCDLYLNSLICLETQDVTTLFNDPSSNQAYIIQQSIDTIVKHHKMQSIDLKLSKAEYTITYDSFKENQNKIEIMFYENDTLRYSFLDKDTKQIDVENNITLVKVDNEYKIESINILKDFNVFYTRYCDVKDKDCKNTIDALKAKYLKDFKEEVSTNNALIEEANSKTYTSNKTYQYEYNRDNAKEYSYKWVNKRNPNYYAYDNSGGNCMNYTSQCIHAGGIPFDYTGKYQWKWYDTTRRTSNNPSGYSDSFVSTRYFYKYAKNNTGAGLVSEVDINPFYGEAGDVLQVGINGSWTHSTIVVGQIKDNSGKVVDLLINSNTSGLENATMLTYLYNKRVIKILGYN